jgi:hypothetical protein
MKRYKDLNSYVKNFAYGKKIDKKVEMALDKVRKS